MLSIGYDGNFPFSFVLCALDSISNLSLFFFAVSSFYLFWSSINFCSMRWSLNRGIISSFVRSFITYEFFSYGDAFDLWPEPSWDLALWDYHLCSYSSSSSLNTFNRSSFILSYSFFLVLTFDLFFLFLACCACSSSDDYLFLLFFKSISVAFLDELSIFLIFLFSLSPMCCCCPINDGVLKVYLSNGGLPFLRIGIVEVMLRAGLWLWFLVLA